MDQKTKQKIARVFEGNLGNRMSEELANGMLQKILTLIEESQGQPLGTDPVVEKEEFYPAQHAPKRNGRKGDHIDDSRRKTPGKN